MTKKNTKNTTSTKKQPAKKQVGTKQFAWATVQEGKITGLEMTRSAARASGLGAAKKVQVTFI